MHKIAAIGMGLAGFAAVAACAHTLDSAQSSNLTWNLHVAGSEAKLAYGQPNSDMVGVMMTCDRGSGRVLVSGDVTIDRPVLVLASGRQTTNLKGDAEADPYTGGLWLQAETTTRDAALRRFARTGDLTLKQAGGQLNMSASDSAKGDIQTFFAHCDADERQA